jgi:hypothetical protein
MPYIIGVWGMKMQHLATPVKSCFCLFHTLREIKRIVQKACLIVTWRDVTDGSEKRWSYLERRPSGVDVMITIFCDFWQFSVKKMAFFSKTNVMIKILNNLALFWVKNANFFAEFFGENILRIITSVPGKTNVWSDSVRPSKS